MPATVGIKALPIRPIERLILIDICTMPEYFQSRINAAERYGVSANYITKILTNLQKKGYIKITRMQFSRRVFKPTELTMEAYAMDFKKRPTRKSKAKKVNPEDDFYVDLAQKNDKNLNKNSITEYNDSTSAEYAEVQTGVDNCPEKPPVENKERTKVSGSLKCQCGQNEEEPENVFRKNSKVLSQEIFNILASKRNKQSAVPTIGKRVAVIHRFQQDFDDDDIIFACEALAIMKKTAPSEVFKEGWWVTFSWLTNPRCLEDDTEYYKRVAWLEKGVCGDVEPDVAFVGLEAWNTWRKEHE